MGYQIAFLPQLSGGAGLLLCCDPLLLPPTAPDLIIAGKRSGRRGRSRKRERERERERPGRISPLLLPPTASPHPPPVPAALASSSSSPSSSSSFLSPPRPIVLSTSLPARSDHCMKKESERQRKTQRERLDPIIAYPPPSYFFFLLPPLIPLPSPVPDPTLFFFLPLPSPILHSSPPPARSDRRRPSLPCFCEHDPSPVPNNPPSSSSSSHRLHPFRPLSPTRTSSSSSHRPASSSPPPRPRPDPIIVDFPPMFLRARSFPCTEQPPFFFFLPPPTPLPFPFPVPDPLLLPPTALPHPPLLSAPGPIRSLQERDRDAEEEGERERERERGGMRGENIVLP